MILSLKSSNQISSELAGKVRELRLQKNWSQEELAKRSGVNAATYRLFEQSGKISLQRFIKIMEVLGRSSDFEALAQPHAVLPSIDDLEKPRRQRGRTRK